MEHRDTSTDIHSMLEQFFEQHIKRRAETHDPSSFINEKQRQFYREIVRALAAKKYVRLMTLVHEKKTIANMFCLEFGDKLFCYTSSFDINFKKYSVGLIIHQKILEYASNRNIHEVSFGAGNEKYKYQFSNDATKLYEFHAHRSWSNYFLFTTTSLCLRIVRWFFRLLHNKLLGKSR